MLTLANIQTYGFAQLLRHQKDVERYERELRKGWDVVLEPEPLVPLSVLAPDNWGYDKHEVGQYLVGDKPVLFVVFDTGHPRSKYLQDFTLDIGANHTTDPDKYDYHSHSSHVGGIIGALVQGSKVGLLHPAGNFKLAFEKILNNSGSGSGTWINAGWEHALTYSQEYISKGWNVIWNNSFGGGPGGGPWQGSEEILKKAKDAGVIIVASAGNSGTAGTGYPGNSQYTIGIGATDQSDVIASFSSRGPAVDFVGGGVSILSCGSGQMDLVYKSGTSMSGPMVAAVMGLVAKANKIDNQDQMYDIFKRNVTDLGLPGKDDSYGWGIPKLSKFPRNEQPNPDPDPKPDPKPDPRPEQPMRTLEVPIDMEFSTVYRVGTGELKRISVWVDPEIQTKLWAEDAIKAVVKETTAFFTNRGFGFSKEVDLYSVAYWVAYFYEMIMDRQQQTPAKLKSITIKDGDGLVLKRSSPTRGTKSLETFKIQCQTFNF